MCIVPVAEALLQRRGSTPHVRQRYSMCHWPLALDTWGFRDKPAGTLGGHVRQMFLTTGPAHLRIVRMEGGLQRSSQRPFFEHSIIN